MNAPWSDNRLARPGRSARPLLLPPALVAALLSFLLMGPAWAEGSGTIAEQRPVIETLAKKIDGLDAVVAAAADDDARLVDLKLTLDQQRRQLLESGVAFRPRLAEINARLDQIGAPPPQGAPPEPEAVTAERNALLAEKADINQLIGQAEDLSLRASQLGDHIVVMRRELFASQLWSRYDLGYAFGPNVAAQFAAELDTLQRSVGAWLRFVISFKLGAALGATLLALLAAVVLSMGGRRLFGSLFYRDPDDKEPSYLSRLSVAFWSTLLPSLAVAVFLGATYFFYDYFNVLRGDIGAILLALFNVIAIVFFVNRLADAVLSPGRPRWRLLAVEPGPARLLVWLVTATAIAIGLDFLLGRVNEAMRSPLSLTVAKSLVATVAVGVFVILIGLVRPFADAEGKPRKWPTLLRYLFFLLAAIMIVSALLGYVGLARFVSRQVVVGGAILATMYIGFLSARAIAAEGAFARTALGRRLERRFAFDETTLDQLGLVAGIAANLVVLLWGVPLILLQWGFQWGDIRTWGLALAGEVRIGSVSFSLAGLLTGVVVFIIGYFATRGFQRWLDGSVMARGRMDSGVRNSIRTAVGYAGVVFAALIGVAAAGIDLSSFALVAGALSLGIGFGLQNIVSNFVSGLILLAERPFKAGDWIISGSTQGIVRKISVRATEIETFQRQTVILPNSELINQAVGNWTHRNRIGRVEIAVSAAYGTDARRVHAILLEIARTHPAVLKNPEPFVAFTGFAEAAMTFEVRVFFADIMATAAAQNEIRFAIAERFVAEGIGVNYRDPLAPAFPAPPAAPPPEPEPGAA